MEIELCLFVVQADTPAVKNRVCDIGRRKEDFFFLHVNHKFVAKYVSWQFKKKDNYEESWEESKGDTESKKVSLNQFDIVIHIMKVHPSIRLSIHQPINPGITNQSISLAHRTEKPKTV